MSKIYCLMTSSVSLSTKMADLLFDTACTMIKYNSSRRPIRAPGIEGRVTTKFESQALGAVAGTEFFAEVETEIGRGKVKFLVREADAEIRNKLEWVSFSSIDDMMEDLNRPPSRYAPAYN